MYIYENHLGGGLYASDDLLGYDDLYCEQCGDRDWLIGEADTKEEAYELLKDDYDEEYLNKFFRDWEKIDRAKEVGRTDKPIETSEFPVYKPKCNLVSCRYNADGKCENEEKRKECVEVSRKVLCLYVNDNDDFCGKIEKTGQVVRGKTMVHHRVGIPDRRTFGVYGKLKDFSEISKMTLSTGETLKVYKADGSNRLIEV